MTRFLMFVGVAVVAAAMYVAASSASQQSKGVSVAKFNALSKKVTALTKEVKSDGNYVNNLAYAYLHCSLHYTIGVTQRGDSSGLGGFGYQFIPQGSSTAESVSALDLDNTSSPEFVIAPYNSTDSACQGLVGSVAGHKPSSVLAKFAHSH
jgi:hypothetical protein